MSDLTKVMFELSQIPPFRPEHPALMRWRSTKSAAAAVEYSSAFPFSVKSMSDDAGILLGYASTFGNLDRQGDVVMPGCFKATLRETKGKLPILMAHNTGRIVGWGLDAEEDDHGLKVRGQFILESDEGRNAYQTVKGAHAAGARIGLSIGYGVRDGGAEYDDKKGIRRLLAVDLFEYSLACVPANPRAGISSVKSAGDPQMERLCALLDRCK